MKQKRLLRVKAQQKTTPKQTNNIFITDSAERETINSNLTTTSTTTTTITNTTTTTTTLSFVEGKEGFYCISSRLKKA